MTTRIYEAAADSLRDYAGVPIAFTVESRYRIEVLGNGAGGFALHEEAVTPYLKDYDVMPGEGPLHWRDRWDVSQWGILAAFDGRLRIGGAVVVWKTPGYNDPEMRDDLAILLDLRVLPDRRGRGIGRQLFERAVDLARARRCIRLKVETQNVNVPACKFYAGQGCELGAIHRFAYEPELDEVQLLWYKDLAS